MRARLRGRQHRRGRLLRRGQELLQPHDGHARVHQLRDQLRQLEQRQPQHLRGATTGLGLVPTRIASTVAAAAPGHPHAPIGPATTHPGGRLRPLPQRLGRRRLQRSLARPRRARSVAPLAAMLQQDGASGSWL